MRISPLVAYIRPEHGFLTTSTLYGGMCHILHTCTLNSSSLSAYDTPVGLGFNAAARVNQRPAYSVSFDPKISFSHLISQPELKTYLVSESCDDFFLKILLMRVISYMQRNLLLQLEQTYRSKYCWVYSGNDMCMCTLRGRKIWGIKDVYFNFYYYFF